MAFIKIVYHLLLASAAAFFFFEGNGSAASLLLTIFIVSIVMNIGSVIFKTKNTMDSESLRNRALFIISLTVALNTVAIIYAGIRIDEINDRLALIDLQHNKDTLNERN